MKNFWDKISKNTYYKKIFKNPFTYVTGAVLLSLFQIAIFAVTGSPWGVSGVFANWGAWIYELLGGSVDKWHYFSSSGAQATLDNGILNHGGSWLNFGIIAGVAATLGGLLMGYGARLAGGCNIGALFSSIASLSLSGWFFAIFLFVGAFIGSKLLAKFFM